MYHSALHNDTNIIFFDQTTTSYNSYNERLRAYIKDIYDQQIHREIRLMPSYVDSLETIEVDSLPTMLAAAALQILKSKIGVK